MIEIYYSVLIVLEFIYKTLIAYVLNASVLSIYGLIDYF